MELLWSVLVELLTPQNGWSLHLVVRVLLSTVLLFAYIVMLARGPLPPSPPLIF